jgi:hypothetical protein
MVARRTLAESNGQSKRHRVLGRADSGRREDRKSGMKRPASIERPVLSE